MKDSISSEPLRFIMFGGFLGAGKTTCLLQLAHHFQKLGIRVGLISNDQAQGLVDTALMEELNIPVREIAGGCFCCRSESLVEALDRLAEEARPEVFLAEPVGSCTDLVATVSLPLERIYGRNYVIAPYSVVIDPYRAMQTLGTAGYQPSFSSDVSYIYRKQLEEAEIIVINKVDVLSNERLTALRSALEQQYPDARIFAVGARGGQNLESWFEVVHREISQPKRLMEVDYIRYGSGEAMLGWYNAKIDVKSAHPFDPDEWLSVFVKQLHQALKTLDIEVAHLKAVLSCENGDSDKTQNRMAAVNLVRTDGEVEASRHLGRSIQSGELLLNLRAEGDPAAMEKTVFGTIGNFPSLSFEFVRKEAFRPSQPVPTHRVDTL